MNQKVCMEIVQIATKIHAKLIGWFKNKKEDL